MIDAVLSWKSADVASRIDDACALRATATRTSLGVWATRSTAGFVEVTCIGDPSDRIRHAELHRRPHDHRDDRADARPCARAHAARPWPSSRRAVGGSPGGSSTGSWPRSCATRLLTGGLQAGEKIMTWIADASSPSRTDPGPERRTADAAGSRDRRLQAGQQVCSDGTRK
jgi:hypothetical protein